MSFLFGGKPKSVRGDVVLITGGAMGIGRLMALKFAKLGATVVIWDLNEDLGAQVVNEIRFSGGPKAHFYKMDVTNRELVYSTAKTVISEVGGVDILINNAGILDAAPILESNDAVVVRTMNVNATSHIWTIKAFLPGMVQRNKGNIVSIASAAGIFGCGGMIDYAASKFASVGIMVSLRQELQAMGKDGIHCTLVCPSFVKTGMAEGVQPPRLTNWLSPDFVAEAVVSAVRRNQWRVILPRLLVILELFMSLMPDWLGLWLIKFTRVAQSAKAFKQTRPHTMMIMDEPRS